MNGTKNSGFLNNNISMSNSEIAGSNINQKLRAYKKV